MGALEKPMMTAAEYLARERAAATKSEFCDGEIFAMAGTSKNHARIVMNFSRELSNLLKGRKCEPFASDLRVKVEASGLYTYPDFLVVGDDAQFEDAHLDTLLNPALIIEVLSDSTEQYDRVKKFDFYRAMPSLQEYVLVSQSAPRVEQFLRTPAADWIYRVTTDPAAGVQFPSISCQIALAEIYDRVEFPPDLTVPPDPRERAT